MDYNGKLGFLQQKACLCIILGFSISSVTIILTEMLYRLVRGNRYFFINMAVWIAVFVLYSIFKKKSRRIIKAVCIIAAAAYIFSAFIYCRSLPQYTYKQAAAAIIAEEYGGADTALIPSRQYQGLFVEPTGYVIIFDDAENSVYFFDPYQGYYKLTTQSDGSSVF